MADKESGQLSATRVMDMAQAIVNQIATESRENAGTIENLEILLSISEEAIENGNLRDNTPENKEKMRETIKRGRKELEVLKKVMVQSVKLQSIYIQPTIADLANINFSGITYDPESETAEDATMKLFKQVADNLNKNGFECPDPNKEPLEFFQILPELLNKLAENNKEKNEALDTLKSIIPRSSVINNSKLSNELTKDFLNSGAIPVKVGSRKKNPIIITAIAAMAYEGDNLQINGKQSFTPYDRAVYNAICSLYEAGNTYFTSEMVYRAMNGITNTRYITPQSVGAVTRSIEKLRTIKLTIDCTDQLKDYSNLAQATYDDMLLSVKKMRVINQNGDKIEAYAFNTIPILYDYSKRINQVLSVPPALLNSSQTVRTSDEIVVIREYLIRRIATMKNKKNKIVSNRITYDSVYKELGIDISALNENTKKNTTKRVRQNTRLLMDHLKKNDYIKDFREYKNGKITGGIEVIL